MQYFDRLVRLLLSPQPKQRDARASTMGRFIKTGRISVLAVSTSAPASMAQWAACLSAPATCPWHLHPVRPHSWSRCRASAASASTATGEPPSCPQLTGNPSLPRTRPTPAHPTRSLIRSCTASCIPTNPKRRSRTSWATSWWRWDASGTSYVEASTWRVRRGATAWPHCAVCFLYSIMFVLQLLQPLTHKWPHCAPPCICVCQRLCEACFPLAPCTPEVLRLTQHIPLSPSFPSL